MLLFGHQWNEERGEWVKRLGVALYAVKIYLACDLMLKKKLLLLVTELVAILNYLGVIHL